MNATKLSMALAAVVICTAWTGQAFAGNSNGCQGNCAGGDTTNNYDQRNYGGNTNNAGGQGGNGYGGSGTGIGVGIAGASADVKNTNSNLNAQGQMQGQGQQQGQGQGQHQSATGGSSNQSQSSSANGSNTGSNIGQGNSTNVNFEGSTYKEAAQTAYAPTPSGPRTSCRIFIGFGGSSTSGSLSGGVPLLNDGLCVAGAQVEFMNTVNKIQANTFSVQDYLVAVCAVEGMDKMAACKK